MSAYDFSLLARQPIAELGLSVRIANQLRAAGITSIGELCERRARDLLLITHVGPDSVRAVVDALTQRGLSLRELDP
ncbi:DNA-directed RNA polymerase alpha subunit [Paraburkholderia sp. WC7.3g]|uniref:DNA-directed RNA polymerase subunit alpha C-terminal domain-containing protein n=1 Tax=Paraburkholderia sp. WC7.3g TaxID=2991070 RepID=UPI003D1B2721